MSTRRVDWACLLDAVYALSEAPGRLGEVFAQIAQLLGAGASILHGYRSGRVLVGEGDPELLACCPCAFRCLVEVAPPLPRRPRGPWRISGSGVLGPAHWARCLEACRPAGCAAAGAHLLTLVLPLDAQDPERDLGLSLVRPADAPAFAPVDRAQLELLAPHLLRALRYRARLLHLEGLRHSALAACDRIADGVLLLDAEDRLLSHSPAAAALLEGLFTLVDGRPQPRCRPEAEDYAAALRRALGPPAQPADCVLHPEPGAAPIFLTVHPFPAETAAPEDPIGPLQARALVVLRRHGEAPRLAWDYRHSR